MTHNLTNVMCDDHKTAYEIVVESENKAVSLTTDYFFRTILSKRHHTGTSSLFALDEIAQRVSGGCAFKNFSPLFETFNDMIGHNIANGFSKQLNEGLFPPIATKIDDIGPQVLTMEHLGLSFIACFIPLCLAFAVFCMELLVHATKSK